MLASGDSVLGSGREPCLFACNVPASGIIIIDPVSLTMLPKQCWYYSLMKWLDDPLSPFNLMMVLLMFNISFLVFFSWDDSSVLWFIYPLIHTTTISPNISVMSSFKLSLIYSHTRCISSLILVALLLVVSIISFMKTWSSCPAVFEPSSRFLPIVYYTPRCFLFVCVIFFTVIVLWFFQTLDFLGYCF